MRNEEVVMRKIETPNGTLPRATLTPRESEYLSMIIDIEEPKGPFNKKSTYESAVNWEIARKMNVTYSRVYLLKHAVMWKLGNKGNLLEVCEDIMKEAA